MQTFEKVITFISTFQVEEEGGKSPPVRLLLPCHIGVREAVSCSAAVEDRDLCVKRGGKEGVLPATSDVTPPWIYNMVGHCPPPPPISFFVSPAFPSSSFRSVLSLFLGQSLSQYFLLSLSTYISLSLAHSLLYSRTLKKA